MTVRLEGTMDSRACAGVDVSSPCLQDSHCTEESLRSLLSRLRSCGGTPSAALFERMRAVRQRGRDRCDLNLLNEIEREALGEDAADAVVRVVACG